MRGQQLFDRYKLRYGMTNQVRVLHVDDDPQLVDLTAAVLEQEHDQIAVETATNADEGLNQIKANQPHCVVSDYDMPGQNGIEFLRSVRERWPELPFILFTGKGSEQVASEAISAGVTDYLQKSTGTEQYELLANRIANVVDQFQANQQLQQEQRRFQTLFDHLSQPTVEVQYEADEPIITQVNAAFVDVFGYDADALVGDSLDSYIVPDDRTDEARAINQHVQSGGRLESREVTRQTADGPRKFLLQNAVYDDGSGGFAIYTDITQRSEHGEALDRNRELLQQTEQLAAVGGWEADVDTGEQRWTRGTYRIHDLDPREFDPSVEAGIAFYHPEDRAAIETAVENCRTHGEAYERDLRLITADGEQKWVRTIGAPVYEDGEIVKIRGAIRDITQQRERQQELEQIETLFQHTQDHLYLIDTDGEFTIERLNPAWEEIPGISVEESCGQTVRDVLGETQAKKLEQRYQECLENGEPLNCRETLRFGEDDIRWESKIAPVTIDGEVKYIAGAGRDITETHERKQELLELKQQYQTLAENFPDGAVYLIDENRTCVRVRGQELANVGLSPADIEGHTLHEVFPDSIAETTRRHIEMALDGTASVYEQEYKGNRYRNQAVPVRTDGEHITHAMVVAQNITEFAQNREELERQNDRLEEFASVVSHDLRNPLNVAQIRLELAQDQDECGSESAHVAAATDAINRSQALIDDLLTLARGGETITDTESVALPALTQECWKMIPDTEAATLTVDTTQPVLADQSRLQQLLENLFANAVEHGGEDVTVRVGDLPDGFYVADDGVGVPEQERKQIFDAGYSTTPGGSGFGLRIVKQVVDAHGWAIELTASDDGGARFEITGVDTGE